jgi:menaquinone-dependent protoporphyrinogen IX oxidase
MKNKMNKSEQEFIGITPTKPNIIIHIAKDIAFHSTDNYNWFHKIMARLLLGWKVTKYEK